MTASGELKAALADVAARVEMRLQDLLPISTGNDAVLHEAMRYAALAGGKRMRAFLAVESAALFGADQDDALTIGAAIEMLHAYSLVHDDLPALDDAALRRGRPTCHLAFDEATAIIAGDALQTRAFELFAGLSAPADRIVVLIRAFAEASGAAGMCGGQMADMVGETRTFSLEEVMEMERGKTGALIRFSAMSGALLAGCEDHRLDALEAYGAALGVAFQIHDDVLDCEGTEAQTGKDLGRDVASGKSTIVSLMGIEAAKASATRYSAMAIDALAPFGSVAEHLRNLAIFATSRHN